MVAHDRKAGFYHQAKETKQGKQNTVVVELFCKPVPAEAFLLKGVCSTRIWVLGSRDAVWGPVLRLLDICTADLHL